MRKIAIVAVGKKIAMMPLIMRLSMGVPTGRHMMTAFQSHIMRNFAITAATNGYVIIIMMMAGVLIGCQSIPMDPNNPNDCNGLE